MHVQFLLSNFQFHFIFTQASEYLRSHILTKASFHIKPSDPEIAVGFESTTCVGLICQQEVTVMYFYLSHNIIYLKIPGAICPSDISSRPRSFAWWKFTERFQLPFKRIFVLHRALTWDISDQAGNARWAHGGASSHHPTSMTTSFLLGYFQWGTVSALKTMLTVTALLAVKEVLVVGS